MVDFFSNCRKTDKIGQETEGKKMRDNKGCRWKAVIGNGKFL